MILTSPDGRFRVVNSLPEMAEQLDAIQRASFPTLASQEWITAAHYRSHIEKFPEGQFAVLDERDRAVGCSTDFRTREGSFWSFEKPNHTYMQAVGNNWLTQHDPQGDWLYGADIGVLPDYRSQGLGKLLYQARHALIRKMNLKGHIAGGMPKGFYKYQGQMDIETYIGKVVAGELFDPVLSVQLKRGFVAHSIMPEYLDDPSCGRYGVLIVWKNPEYTPSQPSPF